MGDSNSKEQLDSSDNFKSIETQTENKPLTEAKNLNSSSFLGENDEINKNVINPKFERKSLVMQNYFDPYASPIPPLPHFYDPYLVHRPPFYNLPPLQPPFMGQLHPPQPPPAHVTFVSMPEKEKPKENVVIKPIVIMQEKPVYIKEKPQVVVKEEPVYYKEEKVENHQQPQIIIKEQPIIIRENHQSQQQQEYTFIQSPQQSYSLNYETDNVQNLFGGQEKVVYIKESQPNVQPVFIREHHHSSQIQPIIVREKEPAQIQPIIVREKEPPQIQPIVVREKEPPQIQTVIIREKTNNNNNNIRQPQMIYLPNPQDNSSFQRQSTIINNPAILSISPRKNNNNQSQQTSFVFEPQRQQQQKSNTILMDDGGLVSVTNLANNKQNFVLLKKSPTVVVDSNFKELSNLTSGSNNEPIKLVKLQRISANQLRDKITDIEI
jgi:hypothetical protein